MCLRSSSYALDTEGSTISRARCVYQEVYMYIDMFYVNLLNLRGVILFGYKPCCDRYRRAIRV
jgi:hypothetical protein